MKTTTALISLVQRGDSLGGMPGAHYHEFNTNLLSILIMLFLTSKPNVTAGHMLSPAAGA